MFFKAYLAVVLCAVTAMTLPAQTFSTLVNFDTANGANPALESLVQGTDGNLYGTTSSGGPEGAYSGNAGTIFKVTPAGAMTLLHDFCVQIFCPDGGIPAAGLLQAGDGSFYGSTTEGGSNCSPNGCGTIFKITPTGALTTLYSFCAQPNCTDGETPSSWLIQATDGNFCGSKEYGGLTNDGTIFKITPSGTLTTLHTFSGSDGANPIGGLMEGADGALYGTTEAGGLNVCSGPNGCGTLFKITLTGTLVTLHEFESTDGSNPSGGLIQATNGVFYGTTNAGGEANTNCYTTCGTVFQITADGELTTL